MLAAGVFLSYDHPHAPQWYLVVPLAWLAVNLLCAMAANVKLRRGGLLVFHVALLSVIVLVALGRLTHLDGQLEISEGSAFSASAVHITRRGPAHSCTWCRCLARCCGGMSDGGRPSRRPV